MKKTLFLIFIIVLFILTSASAKPFMPALKSAAIPGWGLIASGEKAGYAFTAADGALLVLTASFYAVSEYYKNNSADYASVYFNRDISHLSGDLLSKMEMYVSSDRYNSLLPLRARDIYPDNPDLQNDYIDSHLIPDSLAWDWKDESALDKYYRMRSQSRVYNMYFGYAAAGVVLNHVISAVSTYIISDRKINGAVEIKGTSEGAGLGIGIGVRF